MSINCKYSRFNNRIMLLVLTFIFLVNFYGEVKVYATPTELDSKIILIDAGHGGVDGGAVSRRGTVEKHINLSISLKVRDRLQKLGYEVMMTREDDRGLYTQSKDIRRMKREDLDNRCKLKRDSNCDLFISIHQNFFEQSQYYGSQVWYSKNDESKEFAHILQENLKKDLGKNTREEKEAKGAYKILRCYTNIPSVIVECGFITNLTEERKLVTEAYQDMIAESIAKSIKEYFENIE
jgi:N-acetylmuramoyl-L-alanine amidase